MYSHWWTISETMWPACTQWTVQEWHAGHPLHWSSRRVHMMNKSMLWFRIWIASKHQSWHEATNLHQSAQSEFNRWSQADTDSTFLYSFVHMESRVPTIVKSMSIFKAVSAPANTDIEKIRAELIVIFSCAEASKLNFFKDTNANCLVQVSSEASTFDSKVFFQPLI